MMVHIKSSDSGDGSYRENTPERLTQLNGPVVCLLSQRLFDNLGRLGSQDQHTAAPI